MATIDGKTEADIRRETLLDYWARGWGVREIARALGEAPKDTYRSLKEAQKELVAKSRGESHEGDDI